VFVRSPVLPTLRGTLALLLLALGLYLFLAARREVERSAAGEGLSIAFSGDLPTRLLRGGVYAWIRHPFYAAYLATWLAGVVVANTWVDVVLTASGTGVMAAMYVHAARQEEAKFARTHLAADYADYRRVAGMFLPRVWRRPRAAGDAMQP
jgi:protein-S-isoprenylcysteine O-methyltransferase Ste14